MMSSNIKCSTCNKSKSTDCYSLNRSKRNGLQSRCKECVKIHRDKNKESIKAYKLANKDVISAQRKEYRAENKEKISEYDKSYREKNHDKHITRCSEWHKNNKDHTSEYRREYRSIPEVKIAHSLRERLRSGLVNHIKCESTLDLVGMTGVELREWLESQFVDGMTWDNYGYDGWHIDHIRPCASFDMSDPEEQRKCFNYTNLQPLWAMDNFVKGDRWAE